MTTPTTLSAIRLFVRELAPCLPFYRDHLGLTLKVNGSGHGFLVFDGGGIDVVIEAVAHDAPTDEQALVGRFSGASFTSLDIHADHARLVAAGVAVEAPPERQFWGGWLITLRDPAGNGLQLVQQPG